MGQFTARTSEKKGSKGERLSAALRKPKGSKRNWRPRSWEKGKPEEGKGETPSIGPVGPGPQLLEEESGGPIQAGRGRQYPHAVLSSGARMGREPRTSLVFR